MQNMSVKSISLHVLSLIFPNRCIFCGRIMSSRHSQIYICSDCAETIVFSDEISTCRLCGCPLKEGGELCNTCQTHRHFFDQALSCLTYELAARKSILQYKFGNRPDFATTFAAMMTHRIRPLCNHYAFNMVLCVPLSENSLLKRGYNQSALLAQHIAKDLNIPFVENAFSKIRETPKQSSLHYAERMHNVAHTFALALPKSVFANKSVLLIDDVLTTGATADALSKLLKEAGADLVVVATVATTEPDRLDKINSMDWEDIMF